MKHEYYLTDILPHIRVYCLSSEETLRLAADRLNELANQGWRLIAVNNGLSYFEREIP